MKKAQHFLKTVVILTAIFSLFTCNPIEKDTKSASMLVVESLTGTDIDGNERNFLQSDVVIVDIATGQATVFADAAKAVLSAKLLDPNPGAVPSQYNSIQVTRYVVTYFRSDGKNQEGVEIPYSFEGSLSTLVEVGALPSISFVIVRAASKLEPPLVDLTYPRGEEGELKVTARVDFYGNDLANRKVKATGYLTIYFANYSDE
jgi:hypothetical protein